MLSRFLAFADRTRTHLAWLGPLIVRVAVGWTFMMTGWGKLHNLENVTGFFESLKIPAPAFHAYFVSSLEFGGGALLIVGALTRWISLPLIGVMAVAIWTAKWDDIHGLTDLFGTSEFAYLAAFVWLALAGGGSASVDGLWHRLRGTAPAAGVEV